MERTRVGMLDRVIDSAVQSASVAFWVVWYNWVQPLFQRDRSEYYAALAAVPEPMLDGDTDDDDEPGANIVHL